MEFISVLTFFLYRGGRFKIKVTAKKPHATFLHTQGNFLTFQDMVDKEKELIKELLNIQDLEDSYKMFKKAFETKFMAFVKEENQYVINHSDLYIDEVGLRLLNLHLNLNSVDVVMKALKDLCKKKEEELNKKNPTWSRAKID